MYTASFFFNDTATTEIYTLSLHDALPICSRLFFAHVRASTGTSTTRANCHPFAHGRHLFMHNGQIGGYARIKRRLEADRKSTRLNSSHANISYAVFCLKKKMTCHCRRKSI